VCPFLSIQVERAAFTGRDMGSRLTWDVRGTALEMPSPRGCAEPFRSLVPSVLLALCPLRGPFVPRFTPVSEDPAYELPLVEDHTHHPVQARCQEGHSLSSWLDSSRFSFQFQCGKS